jgi:hypothetical protein
MRQRRRTRCAQYGLGNFFWKGFLLCGRHIRTSLSPSRPVTRGVLSSLRDPAPAPWVWRRLEAFALKLWREERTILAERDFVFVFIPMVR